MGIPGVPLALVVPLTARQVEAAGRLHEELVGWRLSDDVLADLREHFPSNDDVRHVLPKAVTLNSLYATTVYAIRQMAQHVVDVHSAGDWGSPAELANRIACLRIRCKERRFLSFASKYCHFFVDQARFPIWDTFAREALMLHLGKVKVEGYQAYTDALSRLCQSAGGCTFSELDRYLWLRGQWEAHRRCHRVSPEVLPLFDAPSGETGLLLVRHSPSLRAARSRRMGPGPTRLLLRRLDHLPQRYQLAL